MFGVGTAGAQTGKSKPQSKTSKDKDSQPDARGQVPADDTPPEEDESEAPTQYTFNPMQASKDLRIGKFYWSKGRYIAAAGRFSEATKWNPGFTEAYLRLGEAEAKLGNRDAAKKAYQKVLELSPDSKEAREAKRLKSKL